MDNGNVSIKPNMTIDIDVTRRKDAGTSRRSFIVPPLPWLKYDERGKVVKEKGVNDNGT